MPLSRHLLLGGTFILGLAQGCSDLGLNLRAQRQLPPDTSDQVTITQGVWGNVWFWSGAFGLVESTGTITPVRREIFVYEATRMDSVERTSSGSFFTAIHSRLVARTESNSTGFFQVSLPVGKYSFFILEDSLFYAEEGDSAGHWTSATVLANRVVKRQIDITYAAGF
jgi:hypothetical protein